MAEHNLLGQEGEERACAFLLQKGYTLLHRNWRHLKEEIDIVMSFREEIIFVEVKTRASEDWEPAELAVTRKKQRNLISAAEAYIFKYDIQKEARFDIVSVYIKGKNSQIDHIEQAFYAEQFK